MRVILILLLSIFILNGETTNTKIKKSKKELNVVKRDKRSTSAKLSEVVKSIKKTKLEQQKLDNKLIKLKEQKKVDDILYKRAKIKLDEYNKLYRDTEKEIKKRNMQFLSLLSNQFGIIFAMKELDKNTPTSIIYRELYSHYKTENIKELQDLKSDISKWKRKKNTIVSKQKDIKRSMRRIENQKLNFKKQKKKKAKLLSKLATNEGIYKKKLSVIIDKQASLRSTLANLNILKAKDVDKAKAAARARKKALKHRKKGSKSKTNSNSSYYKTAVTNYRGSKTISPIENATVTKRFGSYTDPIYNIKIFNDSITLESPSSNSKVKSVLSGKIVFSGKSSMLGNVIVISHSKKIHTIYAGLSRIAPTIRVGKRVKRGYIIGRISKKLIFQATKNSKHINPLKLIRL